MNSFTERLDYLLKKSGATHSDIFEKTKVSSGNLSSYKSGRVKPSFDAIVALSDFFGVSTDWLLKGIGPGPDGVASRRIPIFDRIPVDAEILQDDKNESFIDLPDRVSADFACQVTSDNMKYVGINDGDIAFVRQADGADIGQVIAVHQPAVDDAIRLGFFCKKNGQACLRSANPDCGDILLTPQHHVDGVVVALLKRQVPALADYERLLDHKHLLDAIWSEIAALAGKNGIPAEFVKKLIEVQVAITGKRA